MEVRRTPSIRDRRRCNIIEENEGSNRMCSLFGARGENCWSSLLSFVNDSGFSSGDNTVWEGQNLWRISNVHVRKSLEEEGSGVVDDTEGGSGSIIGGPEIDKPTSRLSPLCVVAKIWWMTYQQQRKSKCFFLQKGCKRIVYMG